MDTLGDSNEMSADTVELGLGGESPEPYAPVADKKRPPTAPSLLQNKYTQLRFQDLLNQIEVGDRELEVIPEKFHDMADRFEVRDLILSLVTRWLKRRGLWKSEQEEICLTDAFPRADFKMDPRFRKLSRNEIENGTFLEEDELTDQDKNHGEGALLTGTSRIYRLPALAEPSINRVLRAPPASLRHQIARRMIDTRYFEDFSEHRHLHASCYLFSKNVDSREHFDDLMTAGLQRIMGHFSFEQYTLDKLKLVRLLDLRICDYFVRLPTVQKALRATYNDDDVHRDARKIWPRFYQVFESLTAKQRNALKKVYMNSATQTYEEAAADFKISIDSLQDRLTAAIQKFETEFPEFCGITPRPLPKVKLQSDLAFNGLWRESSSNHVAPLYRVDLKTGARMEIPPLKARKRDDLTFNDITRIKAAIIETTPIPYFHETFYGDGVYPTILSFGYGAKSGGLSDSDQEGEGS